MKKVNDIQEHQGDLKIIRKDLKSFQAITYNPLANEKYAYVMMAIEDVASTDKGKEYRIEEGNNLRNKEVD